jgi:hypothetical protein
VWGLVDQGLQPAPKYRIYRNGADFGAHASDLTLVNGVAQFHGTDGDTAWYVYVDGTGWQVVQEPKPDLDTTAPAIPQGLKAE